ncbi:MAG: response regulator, partial [Thermoanaerobaculia bacterium]|nr:response regulator [Thermoanaerobaculia bacterium]
FELIDYLLAHAGWQTSRARDGAEFGELLAEATPDLVLLDMNLPDGSGLDLLARLRANPRLASLPVIAVTAHAMQGDKQKFLDAGCDAYVAKPIDRGVLFAEIDGALARRRR